MPRGSPHALDARGRNGRRHSRARRHGVRREAAPLLLNESMTRDSEALLMFAARREHLELGDPAGARRGDWVVCDRFTDATYAYQGGGHGVPLARIRELEQWVHGGLPARPHVPVRRARRASRARGSIRAELSGSRPRQVRAGSAGLFHARSRRLPRARRRGAASAFASSTARARSKSCAPSSSAPRRRWAS